MYSRNKAALINILRVQGNEPSLGDRNVAIWKTLLGNKTFATSAGSDQPAYPHEHGCYNLQADYTI